MLRARIHPIEQNENAKTRELLAAIKKQMGAVPNMISTMAQSPACPPSVSLHSPNVWQGACFPLPCDKRFRLRSAKPISAITVCRPTAFSERKRASPNPIFSTLGMERLPTKRPVRRWRSPEKSPKTVVM